MAQSTEALTVSRADAQKYEKYEKWYKNEDGLFGALGKFLAQTGAFGGAFTRVELAGTTVSPRSSVENLRNPVPRIVEFYATTMLSGKSLEEALPLQTKVDEGQGEGQGDAIDHLKDAILKVWEWSNLFQSIRVAKRYLARDGQFFEKVARPEGKDFCYLQFIAAKTVTDFTEDERGNVTYIRLDVPDAKTDENGMSRKIWRTEIWRKGKDGQEGYALFAESERTSEASVPTEKRVAQSPGAIRLALGSEATGAYRFDFVPFVVVNAQDTGEKRPEPVYANGLHLIAWVCREATRLSDLMFRFNKAFKVVFGMGNDKEGRPMPAPRIQPRDLGAMQQEQASLAEHTVPFAGSRGTVLSSGDDISIEGIAVTGLPGSAQMADATPNINYEAARQWISDHMREIYEALPELLYYAVESRANQSGVALRTLIAGAINRGEEMQSNIVAGLIKADQMALSIAQLEGFEGFSEGEIGVYGTGDFDHEIDPPEIMPLSDEETEDVRSKKIANAQALVALGLSRDAAMKEVGLDVEGLAPQLEGGLTVDDLTAAAAALASRNGSG